MPQKAVPVSTGYCVCFVNPRPGNYWGGKEIKFSLMFAEIKVFFLFFYLFGWSQSRLRSLNISAPDPLENCSATRVFQFWYSITHKKTNYSLRLLRSGKVWYGTGNRIQYTSEASHVPDFTTFFIQQFKWLPVPVSLYLPHSRSFDFSFYLLESPRQCRMPRKR